MLLIMELYI